MVWYFETYLHIYKTYIYTQHLRIYTYLYIYIYICIHTCFSLRIEYVDPYCLWCKEGVCFAPPQLPQPSNQSHPETSWEMLSVWVLDLLIHHLFHISLHQLFSSNHHLTIILHLTSKIYKSFLSPNSSKHHPFHPYTSMMIFSFQEQRSPGRSWTRAVEWPSEKHATLVVSKPRCHELFLVTHAVRSLQGGVPTNNMMSCWS